VEAEKESGVRDAISGLRVVMRSKQPQLVPVEEMTDAITVKSAARSDLAVGAWVRVQSGAYKGDLAVLQDTDAMGSKVVIKVVPRIDYQEYIKRCARATGDDVAGSRPAGGCGHARACGASAR